MSNIWKNWATTPKWVDLVNRLGRDACRCAWRN